MKRFFGLIVVLVALFVVPPQAFAVDYSIENMQINAFLQENGDVHVIEEQTYDFRGKFNGITRTLIPKVDTAIIDVVATENDLPLKVEQEDHLYKVYRDGKDETVTIQLTYTIKDGVQVYADVAEFYWPFFDTGNESAYEKLDVFVHPPNPTDDVIAFGYDAAEGTARTEKDSVAHFAMGKVSSETKGDIRVAYDVILFPQAMVTKDEPMRAKILAEKGELEEKRQKFVTNQHKTRTIAPFVVGMFFIILVGLFGYAWLKKQSTRAEVARLYPLPYFVPDEELSMLATISYTNMGVVPPEALTAALLDLVRKKHVKQTDEDTFIVKDRDTDYAHEQILIAWLFDKIGDNGVFKFDDLEAYTDEKSNRTVYNEDFTKWQKAIQEEVKYSNLTENNAKLRWIVALTSIFVLPFIILFIVYDLLGFMFLAFVLFLALLFFAIFYRPRTLKGAKIKREWTEFRKRYIDMNEKEWTDLVDDEQMRAFIYGIGINDKRIKDKNKTLLSSVSNIQHDEMSPFLFLLIATNANTHFSAANNVASASATGGTSGGGTGVGGGGGGSGAF